jgi:hypothetical protein
MKFAVPRQLPPHVRENARFAQRLRLRRTTMQRTRLWVEVAVASAALYGFLFSFPDLGFDEGVCPAASAAQFDRGPVQF